MRGNWSGIDRAAAVAREGRLMTAAEFRQAGEFLFGESWHGAMASILDANLRSVQRWASGAERNPVPDHAAADVARLVAIKQRRQAERPA